MPPVSARVTPKLELPVAWSGTVDDYATVIDVSRDGTLFAVGTGAGRVHVFDVATGQSKWQVEAHRGGVLALEWSPRARTLATAGQDGTARMHDAEGNELARCPGMAGWVEHLAWSPDGKRFATASGKGVRIWTAAGEPVLETEPHESTVTGLKWNRHGTELATACYGGVRIFSVASGAGSRHLRWRGSLISLAWSPTDEVIACGTQECSVHFWRLRNGQDSEMSGFPSKPRALAWDSEGRLLATGGDATVTVWAFEGKGPEGKPPIELESHHGLCTALAFHPKRPRLASGADDMGVLVWDPRRSVAPIGFAFLEESVTALAWTLGGKLLFGSDAAGSLRAWTVE